MIKKYKKVNDEFTTYGMLEPDYKDGDARITELCAIDGDTYVHIPEVFILPIQPDQITLEDVTLTDELKAEIKAASPHIKLINKRVVAQIRGKYTFDDELKMHREYVQNGSTPETQAYIDHVETCRAWGQARKTLIGL